MASFTVIGVFLWVLAPLPLAYAELSAFERELIQNNIDLSKGIDSFAESLDVFLTGRKVTKDKNKTSVVINNSTYHSEGQPVKNATHIDVNLRLPNFEEYWQLRFTSYDENEEDRGVEKTYFRKSPRRDNYGASLGWFKKIGNIRTTFRPRMKLQDPLQISYVLRFEAEADMKTYRIKPRVEFFAHPEKGTNVFSAFNVDYVFSPFHTLTFLNESEYQDFQNTYSATNGLTFGQVLTKKTAMVYSFLLLSNNRPDYHLQNYVASVGWNQVVYKRVLETRLVPYLDFAKDRSFKGNAGISFNLGLIF